MLFAEALPPVTKLRTAVRSAARMDETACVLERLAQAALPDGGQARITAAATRLVETVRENQASAGGLDVFLQEYGLTSHEGVTLMCLAEALLRVPDAKTADRLIKDRIGGADWEAHMGQSSSWFVNASTWALLLTGRVLELDDRDGGGWQDQTARLVARAGEPVIRQAVTQAMRIMGRQFVMGRTISEALERAGEDEARGYRHTFDMLGEAARTAADAERYFDAYESAIAALGDAAKGRGPEREAGVSVKLSALHPRYELAQRDRVMAELAPRLIELAQQAKAGGIGLTVDAEEAGRLDLSLDIFERVARDPSLSGWDGLGLALQAYLKAAMPLIDWLAELAASAHRRIGLRLVKGAYWDSEIKLGQTEGLADYPVFTRKRSTDVSYIACAKRIFAAGGAFYPAFATHNAHTLATVLELAGGRRDYEFQRLHGMGEPLYDSLLGEDGPGIACRIYAPVGGHAELLAYLVRRLLENGANTSFVNRIVDREEAIEDLIADPVAQVAALAHKPHPQIVKPPELYGPERDNAPGIDLNDPAALMRLDDEMTRLASEQPWTAAPLIAEHDPGGLPPREVLNPADHRHCVGEVTDANAADAVRALDLAVGAQPAWNATPASERAAILRRAAGLFGENMAALMLLAVHEAGKTIPDALAEVREAIDFLRYYAMRAEQEFAAPAPLPGPTGEDNTIALAGRGVFLCISPWNFPLAIFTGQIAAALAAGNAVLAKPAEQTSLMAARACKLLYQAGVPRAVLYLLPGNGPALAAPLLADPRLGGVAFTGSTGVARTIARALAARDGPIAPLIAETGGQNAMIVDSTALPEQVCQDVLASAFASAGQRCSALRVLFLQEDVAVRQLAMITGAMAELRIGDPALLSSDIGPVIDEAAQAALGDHAARMAREGSVIYRCELPPEAAHGTFVAPQAFEIDDISQIGGEHFGPLLHVVRYQADRLDQVVDALNATGYGLTLGIHSRIRATVDRIVARARVGNIYVNRNQIGAIVGVQPFGGEGLSGTGPKAGGPRYLHRFALERTLSTDTTAVGGNATLLALVGERS